MGKGLFFALISILPLTSTVSAAVTGPMRAPYREGEIIVQYRSAPAIPQARGAVTQGATAPARLTLSADQVRANRPASLAALDQHFALRSAQSVHTGAAAPDVWVLAFDPGADVQAAVAEYGADPNVVYAEPNFVGSLSYVPSDPLYAQTSGDLALIGIEAAWDEQAGADASVLVAVIDSGVETVHPDLDGALDLANSYNFVDGNTQVFDDLGHGTRVAGIIAAEGNNAEGIAGVAFGCSVMSLDVANANGEITAADVASALSWATSHGADVANMSLRFLGNSQTLETACDAAEAAGMLLVAAAGNENQGDQGVYPASYDSVIGVGGVMDDGVTRAPWSNYNGYQDDLVELVAPGTTIFSSIPGSQYNGTYGSGTSFAAPMVSGVAALLMSQNPTQSNRAIRSHLIATADGSLPDNQPTVGWAGSGMLYADAAISTAMIPSFEVISVSIDDSIDVWSGNDEDGFWDVGETVNLNVTLQTTGADAASVNAVVSSIDPDVTLSDTATSWGDVLVGTPTSATDVIASAEIDAGAVSHDASFELAITAGDSTSVILLTVSFDNTFTPPTIISEDTTWTADKTYLLLHDTVVMPAATLTVNPGTTVRQGYMAGLEVRGGIVCSGEPEQPVTFTAHRIGGLEDPFLLDVFPDSRDPVISDVNSDGVSDIVYLRWTTTNVRVTVGSLLGGEYIFSELYETFYDFDPVAIAVGDIDNDTDLDIAVVGLIGSPPDRGAALQFYLQSGSTFIETVPYPLSSSNCSDVTIGDADNDGLNEIATSNLANDTVTVSSWDGLSISEERVLTVGDAPLCVVIVDANNDGNNDIVALNGRSDDISLISHNGYGYMPEMRLPVGDNPKDIAVGDVDNDGDNDLVSANASDSTVSLILWDGTSFESAYTLETNERCFFVEIADVDNDGDNDIVTSDSDESSREPGVLSIYLWETFGHSELLGLDGIYYPRGTCVGDLNNDGANDVVVADFQGFPDSPPVGRLKALYWNGEEEVLFPHGGLWVRDAATRAELRHVNYEYGMIEDDSSIGLYSHCLVRESESNASLSIAGGTGSLIGCSAIDNEMGHGIVAATRDLVDCIATGNAGIGLQGGYIQSCTAGGNGGIGIVGSAATQCTAVLNGDDGIQVTGDVVGCEVHDNSGMGISSGGAVRDTVAFNNGKWGISSSSTVSNCVSIGNASGISGSTITDCTADDNRGTGINASGNAVRCQVSGNVGVGLTGSGLTDCGVVGNGSGLVSSGGVSGLTVAQNSDAGITGGSITDSVVHHNSGAGISSTSSVANTWVVENEGPGLIFPGAVDTVQVLENMGDGVISPTTLSNARVESNQGIGVIGGMITTSSITHNVSTGVQTAISITGSNLHGNGTTSGYDYEETRPSTELIQMDVTGNFWGPLTTPIMDAHPWGSFYDIQAIHDFVDNHALTEARYENHLSAPALSAQPDDTPPAFLLSVSPDETDPVNVGLTTFTLTFSEPMDTSVVPAVTFGQIAPFTDGVIEASPETTGGWVDAVTWQGIFAVQSDTGDGINTLRVSGAKSADGFVIPDDTAHQFVIDTSGGSTANNGLATSLGATSMSLSWSENNRPATAQGYNIRRSTTGAPGSYQRVNSTTVTSPSFEDQGLTPVTVYFYIVDLIDDQDNATQWTPPFIGATDVGSGDPPVIAEISDDDAIEGLAYTGPTPTLISGTEPVTWSLATGPSAMTIDSASGVVMWPTPVSTGSPHTVTIQASNTAGTDTESWLLTVTAPLSTQILNHLLGGSVYRADLDANTDGVNDVADLVHELN